MLVVNLVTQQQHGKHSRVGDGRADGDKPDGKTDHDDESNDGEKISHE